MLIKRYNKKYKKFINLEYMDLETNINQQPRGDYIKTCLSLINAAIVGMGLGTMTSHYSTKYELFRKTS